MYEICGQPKVVIVMYVVGIDFVNRHHRLSRVDVVVGRVLGECAFGGLPIMRADYLFFFKSACFLSNDF